VIRRKRALDLMLVLTLFAALGAACAGGKPIDVGPPGGDDDDDGFDGTFSNGAYPALVQENCGQANCHTAANQAATGGLQLPDSAATLTTAQAFAEINAEAVVNTATPASSLLLTKGEGTGHGGSVQWDDNDSTYEAVLTWIQNGALNN
jgi:hypothetical protein